MNAHPEVPVYWVDVKGQRPLSQEIAARLGITHESPQAILLRAGAPVWHDSHFGVTAEAIARELRQRGE
jgi:bacillithiol system protein YtxJ